MLNWSSHYGCLPAGYDNSVVDGDTIVVNIEVGDDIKLNNDSPILFFLSAGKKIT
jgi:hypothetical protein